MGRVLVLVVVLALAFAPRIASGADARMRNSASLEFRSALDLHGLLWTSISERGSGDRVGDLLDLSLAPGLGYRFAFAAPVELSLFAGPDVRFRLSPDGRLVDLGVPASALEGDRPRGFVGISVGALF